MLKIPNKVKQSINATTFTLEADANQSYLIKAIRLNQATTDYITVRVNRQTAAYLRCGGTQGSHIYFPDSTIHKPPLYEMLIASGVFAPIPVPTGYELTITGLDATNQLQVIYDEYDAGDISAQLRNGPDANSYDVIQYGRGATSLVAGENELTRNLTTNEYPDFPFGAVVPAKSMCTIHGIAFSGVGKTTASQVNQHRTDYLRLVKERKVMFDEDLNGFLYRGFASTIADETNVGEGQDMAGNNSYVNDVDYLQFDPPLVFESGEELNLFIDTTVAAGSAVLTGEEAEVAAICTFERQ